MNEQSEATVIEHSHQPLSLRKYIVGFVTSIAITVVAYALATDQSISKNTVVGILAALAIVQFVVQMVFFLHVGAESKPRWKQMVMWLMLMVVLILVVGSIWIMDNLNYRMSEDQMRQYIKSQDGL
jgi:cytochrome o ubiquinol oxidase subunit IV